MSIEHDIEQEGFPSDAPERHTRRVAAKPFGQDKAKALMVREEALRKLTRQEAFDRGYLTVKDMDDEELRYGRMRDRNGNIPKTAGSTMPLIPESQYQDMVAEHERRFNERIRQNLDTMLGVMIEVATDDTVEPRDRFEAAKYLFERQAGKTPEKVAHTVELKPWEGVLTDISGIGAISRAEHRRLQAQGPGAGIIDVEIVDEDTVSPQGVSVPGEAPVEPDVVQVHQQGPDERDPESAGPTEAPARPLVRKEPEPRRYVDGERDFGRDPAAPAPERPSPPVVPPDELSYGSRRTENKAYGDQVRDAEALAARRRESKKRIQDAKKARKIARATGADAIVDDITGATLGEDGQLHFE